MRDTVCLNLHTIKGSLDFCSRDAGLPQGAVIDPPVADVGSAKLQREHPPVYTGLKNYGTRPCGYYLKRELIVYDVNREAKSFFAGISFYDRLSFL